MRRVEFEAEEFGGIIKNVMRHKEKLSHLYIIIPPNSLASNSTRRIFSVGDMVLLKDYMKEKLLPQYNRTYRVVWKIGDKTVDIVDQQGKIRRATFPQIKRITPMEALLTKIPINLRYGRQAKYLKTNLPEILKDLSGNPRPNPDLPSNLSLANNRESRRKGKRNPAKRNWKRMLE